MRPVSREALLALQKSYDVDLTYTSNAIEGNTLTLRETAELIEHGITVGGKSLRDHLEAVDHYNAVLWMRGLAAKTTPIDESTVRELHRRIVFRSQPEIGGIYSTLPRRIAGSPVVFPNAVKIPGLMKEYGEWLAKAAPEPAASFGTHFRLVAIHPFGGRQRAHGQAVDEPALAARRIPARCRAAGRPKNLSRHARACVRAPGPQTVPDFPIRAAGCDLGRVLERLGRGASSGSR